MARNVILAEPKVSLDEISASISVPIGAAYTEQESSINTMNNNNGLENYTIAYDRHG
jgi:hypothetical protein